MDPNATLADLRALVAEVIAREDKGVFLPKRQHAVDMAQLVDSLDEWLTRGGFLPNAWQPNARIDRRIDAWRKGDMSAVTDPGWTPAD